MVGREPEDRSAADVLTGQVDRPETGDQPIRLEAPGWVAHDST